MKNSKEIKLGAILSYIIILANMIIGVLYTPILTEKLGQSEYGLYSLATSIISYLTILDFGFGNAIIIYTARYRVKNEREKQEKLHGMFVLIYSIIGIIAGIIGVFIWINADSLFANSMNAEEIRKAKILLGILTFNLIVTFPLSVFSSIITAYEKFVFAKILNLARIILNPIIMIILLNIGFRSVGLVILTTVLNITTLILNYIYCRKKLKIKLKLGKLDFSLLRDIMAYSVWVFLNSIMDKINWALDQFILGVYVGTVAVAVYSIAGNLNQMYVNFSTAISGVLLPRVTEMEERKASDKEFTDVFIKTGRIQYIVMALIISGFILYGREFINILWVGPDYDQSYFIACLLMIPSTVPLIQNVGLNILQAKNKYKFRVIILLIFAVINVIISIILAQIYGGFGAAMGTAISNILGQIIFMNIFYYKYIKIDIFLFWKNILKMSIPMLVAVIIAILIKQVWKINTSIVLIFQIVIYTCVYAICVWTKSMNYEEKNMIKKLLKR